MTYLTRCIEQRFISMSESYKAVLLVGAKQTGKTTMLRHLEEKNMLAGQKVDRTYVSLENMTTRDMAKNDPECFFRSFRPPVLIDEIQYAPELFEWIRDICDERGEKGLFWLTSSRWNAEIKRDAEALGERLGILEMHGLSRREIEGTWEECSANYNLTQRMRTGSQKPGLDASRLFDFIWQGGMPGAMDGSGEQRAQYFENYLDDHILRDAVYLGGVTDALRFRKYLHAAAVHNGKKLNYKVLAETAGISQPTAKEWMRILEGLGIVYILMPYQHDALKRLVKTGKLYFRDTGLSAYLAGWQSPEMLRKSEAGERYLVNYVIMELMKNYAAFGEEIHLSFYRNAKAREISLILEENKAVHPFEIRMSNNPDIKDIKKFAILDRAGVRCGWGGILCPRPGIDRIHGDQYLIPCDLV